MASTRKWAVNASPIITLAKVGQIQLLEELSKELVIPSGVESEIHKGPKDDPARVWIGSRADLVRPVGNIEEPIAGWDLGLGESQVIHWCRLRGGFEALLDDRAARNCALALGVPTRGTVGVVVLAKREGKLKQVRPVFDRMIQAGFRIDEPLLRTALELASE